MVVRSYSKHHEASVFIGTSAMKIFDYVDDHSRFSSHMNESSWMMGGGRMNIELDEGRGQTVGSHIRLSGKVFGIKIFLDEVVTRREPPYLKIWETVGVPKLLVVGDYQMGLEISDENGGSRLRVFIDYELPVGGITRCLGYLFGRIYAKWCVQQMIQGVRKQFNN